MYFMDKSRECQHFHNFAWYCLSVYSEFTSANHNSVMYGISDGHRVSVSTNTESRRQSENFTYTWIVAATMDVSISCFSPCAFWDRTKPRSTDRKGERTRQQLWWVATNNKNRSERVAESHARLCPKFTGAYAPTSEGEYEEEEHVKRCHNNSWGDNSCESLHHRWLHVTTYGAPLTYYACRNCCCKNSLAVLML